MDAHLCQPEQGAPHTGSQQPMHGSCEGHTQICCGPSGSRSPRPDPARPSQGLAGCCQQTGTLRGRRGSPQPMRKHLVRADLEPTQLPQGPASRSAWRSRPGPGAGVPLQCRPSPTWPRSPPLTGASWAASVQATCRRPSLAQAPCPTPHLDPDPDPRPLETLCPPRGTPKRPLAAQGTDMGSQVSPFLEGQPRKREWLTEPGGRSAPLLGRTRGTMCSCRSRGAL